MRLLFDENLSRRLVDILAELFPGSTHVATCGMVSATDSDVWLFANANGYTIVSKDTDFRHRALTLGPPPKVIVLAVGNIATGACARLLRQRLADIQRFETTSEALLVIRD